MKINKSFITNAIAALFVALSFGLSEPFSHAVLMVGLFALSGAVTNQLAIHMLFEKVPFLYGSGVIPARFSEFKAAIKAMMMEQFFTKAKLDAFFAKEEKSINLTPLIKSTDFTPAFDALKKSVMESPFGGMLGMFGGEGVLNGLKEPYLAKLKSAVVSIVNSDEFNATLQKSLQSSSLSDDMLASVEAMIDNRLAELTPQMVKELIQNLIREHLQWLVVWGGVFGGAIGLLGSFFM
ncbi:MAG: DUF445 domain-containing protein [Epsilonproteobacteria bacterium]|nr:DUF445 domain-containing protein [Campylobacterota bacterium]